MTNKQTAQDKIESLVIRFEEQYQSYKHSDYNETRTRRDFIDPFFKALGWDIDNEQGYAEAYREVIHEDKVKVSGASRAPDYSFRLNGGKRLFFVEAKKPSVSVKEDIHPAYQVRRYGWSAKLPISIVTDFEEFAVYDCTKKPKPNDKPAVARIKFLTFRDYIKEFDFLWDTFSREQVPKGSFDKFLRSDTQKRGTATVDKDFLESLDRWRTYLAVNLSWNNRTLDEDEINFVVQQTIDRIIFLRIAEDRGVEPYGTLEHAVRHGNLYQNLFELFQKADEKYNSGLFDFKKDLISRNVVIENKIIRTIINELYYPECPYEFSVLSVEILGSAYEQFLGKVIRITPAHHAKIEEKPEVRKAGGVYYTPQYIVDYIVKNTLGKLIEGKTPKEISKIKILDPACGSGSFLIGAFQYLLDWHKDFYSENGKTSKGKKDNPLTPDGHLTTAEKKRILLNNIFGVDLDANAVEVTKLSLLLKCMEGETLQSISHQLSMFNERVLPTLDENIKDGNSLIGRDYYSGDLDFGEERNIKPFDWENSFKDVYKQGGFDCVIGNPPYDVLEKDRLGDAVPHIALQKYIQLNQSLKDALGGKLNLYRFFIVKAVQLTKAYGRFGLIVPSSLLADKSCKSTREFLLYNSTGLEFDCFPQKDIPSKRVFEDAKLSTTIFFAERINSKAKSNIRITIRTYPGNSFFDRHKSCTIQLRELETIDPENLPIPLIDKINWNLLVKIHNTSGISRLGSVNEILVRRGEINQTIYKSFIEEKKDNNLQLIKGVQIGQFRFNKKLSQGKIEWFNQINFLEKNSEKELSKIERIATQRITGVDEKLRIVATIIKPPAYFADSTNSISIQPKSNYDLRYLLAILNSRLFQWRFKLTSTNNNVGTNELEAMPFKIIDFNNPEEIKLYNEIVKISTQLILLNEEIQDQKLSTRQTHLQEKIEYLQGNINRLVYQLYGLTEEEIKVIENE